MARGDGQSGNDGLKKLGDLPLLRDLASVSPVDSELIRPEDISYVHSIFLQCFMPVRHSFNGRSAMARPSY
jgi:hypothetical protein